MKINIKIPAKVKNKILSGEINKSHTEVIVAKGKLILATTIQKETDNKKAVIKETEEVVKPKLLISVKKAVIKEAHKKATTIQLPKFLLNIPIKEKVKTPDQRELKAIVEPPILHINPVNSPLTNLVTEKTIASVEWQRQKIEEEKFTTILDKANKLKLTLKLKPKNIESVVSFDYEEKEQEEKDSLKYINTAHTSVITTTEIEEVLEDKKLSLVQHENETKNKNEITYADLNVEQKQAVFFAEDSKSFCLIGSAGTGKTTAQRVIATHLLDCGLIPHLTTGSKRLFVNTPSILICSFTNKAVENIRSAVPEDFKRNCMTIHKAIEFGPIWYEEENDDGIPVKKMRFEPARHEGNLLPAIKICIIEEASTVGVVLFLQLVDALPKGTTFIFLGDLNQLTPVMDDAILGFALNHLPIVELTEIYRQALESPIINFAYKILEGYPLSQPELENLSEGYDRDQLKLLPFKKYDFPELAIKKLGTIFQNLAEAGKFIAETSVVLLPYNTGGDINVENLNKYIAQGFSNASDADIYEIIAGWNNHYYSIGDIIFAAKSLWKIEKIEYNPEYKGRPPQLPTNTIDRWGKVIPEKLARADDLLKENSFSLDDMEDGGLEHLLDSKADEEDEFKKRAASHILFLVSLELNESGQHDTYQLSRAGEFNDSSHGYALTIHKSQGSEWHNVYCIYADQHKRMLNRELLYTSITRARKSLTILYQPEGRKPRKNQSGTIAMTGVFQSGIINQEIKGKKLSDKLEHFKKQERLAKMKIGLRAKADTREATGGIEGWENLEASYWDDNPLKRITDLFIKLNTIN